MMSKELKREVILSDSVQEAIFDYVTTPEYANKETKRIEIGRRANIEACKILKAKGWSNSKIAEHLNLVESFVREHVKDN